MYLQSRAEMGSGSTRPRLYPAGVKILIINVICLLLATTAVALRFLARRMKRVSFFLEDYMVVLGLVCY